MDITDKKNKSNKQNYGQWTLSYSKHKVNIIKNMDL